MLKVPYFRLLNSLFRSASDHIRSAGFPKQHPAVQVRILLYLSSTLYAGAAVVTALLLALTVGTDVWSFVVVWSAAQGGSFVAAIVTRVRPRSEDTSRLLRRSVPHAAFQGVLWGTAIAFLVPDASPAVALAVSVGALGAACAAGLVLGVLPQPTLAAMGPLVGGAGWAVWNAPSAQTAALLALVACGAAIAAAAGIPASRRLDVLLRDEAKLRQQQNIIGLLLREHDSHGSDWLWELDADGKIIRVSRRFAEAAGIPANQLEGRDFLDFLRKAPVDSSTVGEMEAQIQAREAFGEVELNILRKGEERCWRLAGRPSHDEFGRYVGFVGTGSDVTNEKLAQHRIHFLAHNDALTGLFNRENFSERLRQSVARLERYGAPFTILYLDLDQFKSVNDTRGHLVGDKLLIEVGHRVRATLRADDIAARLGGDEFAIILSNTGDTWTAAALAARLIAELTQPYDIDGETLVIGVSIGIALAPINGTRPDQLLRNADLALYRAKADGRGVYRFFETQMDSEARERRVLETELRQAIRDNQLILHYQPLISAEDEETVGFEALLRWDHPIRGIVYPTEFIPIAEQTGLISEIGNWTIRTACAAACGWPAKLSVAVNLSAKHLAHADIAAVVREALAETGLTPHRLELEVTEGLLIKDPEDVIAKLLDIKSVGVTVAMDDFGTGYSSLSSLLKFPFDKIKIDKSIVSASSEGEMARDVLRLISALGSTLKMKITVEGVETKDQVDFLRGIACDNFQGYYFARPLDEFELASYLLTQVRERSAIGVKATDTVGQFVQSG